MTDNLGPDWESTYNGPGTAALNLYGRMPDGEGGYKANVGARIHHDTTCTGCGKRFAEGDCITAELAPDMAGTAHHTDCADPKLERAIDYE